MFRNACALLVVLALAIGCGSRTDFSSKVTSVEENDPQMNAAIQKARDKVDKFIAALQEPKLGQEQFSVKMKLTDGDAIEHMWLSDIRYDGAAFHGLVANEPESLTNVKYGQEASVPRAEISDWMYLQDGKIVGAETTRVLRDTLSPAERAQFDQTMHFAE